MEEDSNTSNLPEPVEENKKEDESNKPQVEEVELDKNKKSETESISTAVPSLLVEFESYFNEGFDIYSINNGIIQTRVPIMQVNDYAYPYEIVEFKIDNVQDFSFQEEKYEVNKTEGNIKKDEEISNERCLKILHTEDNEGKLKVEDLNDPPGGEGKMSIEQSDKETIIEKNENNNITDEFLRDEDFADNPEDGVIREEMYTEDKLDEDDLLEDRVKPISPKKVEEVRDEKKKAELDQVDEESENESEEKNIPIAENFPIAENETENKIVLHTKEEEKCTEEDAKIQVEENKVPDQTEINEECIDRKHSFKTKDDEIKNLYEKLDAQKYQNKLIMDENKKLLEIINIFRLLQNLENEKPVSQTKPSEEVEVKSPTELFNKEKELIRLKEHYNTYSVKSNNLIIQEDLKNIEQMKSNPREISEINNNNQELIAKSSSSEIIAKKQEEEDLFDNEGEREIILKVNKPKIQSDRNILISNHQKSNDNVVNSRKNFINTNKAKKTTSYGAIYKDKPKEGCINNNEPMTKSSSKSSFIKINEDLSKTNNDQKAKKNFITINSNNKPQSLVKNTSNFSKSAQRATDKANTNLQMNSSQSQQEYENMSKMNMYRNYPNPYTNIGLNVINSNNENEINNYIPSISNVSPDLSSPVEYFSHKEKLNENNGHTNILFNKNYDFNSFSNEELDINIDNLYNVRSQNKNLNCTPSSYRQLINLLEKCKEMNDRLITTLNKEDFGLKIDVDKRKKDVENLEEILDYINSAKSLQEKQNHIIPFYLIDKRKLYENIVNYMFEKKQKNLYFANSKSSPSLIKSNSTLSQKNK